MKEVTISEFKAKSMAILREVHSTRKPVRVTRFGRPFAEIIPVAAAHARAAWIGSMKDSMEILGDIVSPPVNSDVWVALKDRDLDFTLITAET